MKFEEFIRRLRNRNYNIVAMYEYTWKGESHIYCLVQERDSAMEATAIHDQGSNYEYVFDNIIRLVETPIKIQP